MPTAVEKGLDLLLGVALLTAETVEQAARELAEKGKEARDNAPAVLEALRERGRPARERVVSFLRDDVWRPVQGLGKPQGGEIAALEERIAALERQVQPGPQADREPPALPAPEDAPAVPALEAAPTEDAPRRDAAA